MKRIIAIALFALVLTGQAQAQDPVKIGTSKFECKKDDDKVSHYFPEIQEIAQKLNQSVCDAILIPTHKSITDAFLKEDLSAFGGLVKTKAIERFSKMSLNNLDKQLDFFESNLRTSNNYPVFNIEKGAGGPADPNLYYFFTGNNINQGILTPADDKKCQAENTLKVPCLTVLEDLKDAIYPYQRNANAFTAYETRAKLSILSKEWDSYFETARAQSFADIAITSVLEKGHFEKNYLVGPPERQWFIFHPNVVMEFADRAPAGEKIKAALIIEWVAVNWWHDSIIGIPFGISLASLYSDRPGVNAFGHGVTLYFDNKYAIGYANHAGENAFYVSYDLLKLFEDKKQQADRYRNRIKEITH